MLSLWGDEFLIVLQDVSIPLLDKELELLRTMTKHSHNNIEVMTLSILETCVYLFDN